MITADDLVLWGSELGRSTKALVAEYVTGALAGIGAQVKALQDTVATLQMTPGPPGPSGPPGRDAEPLPGPKGDRGETGADGAPGRDGTDAILPDLDELARKVAVYVPKPLDGAPGRDGEKGADGAPGAPGRDGIDVDIKAIQELVASESARVEWKRVVLPEIAEAVKALPIPKDGTPGRDGRDGASVTIADLLPLIEARIASGLAGAMKALPAPAPGRDGASVTVDDLRPVIGDAVRTAVDTAVEALPQPRDGRDGLPGVPGPPGEKGLDGSNGRDGIDGRPGEKGADGADGLGLNNAAMTFDETKGYALVLSNGERSFEMRLPQGWDAGVWRPARAYPKGCNVTFKGDQWTAQVDTSNRPGDTPDWRLAVRRGRDGKDLRSAD